MYPRVHSRCHCAYDRCISIHLYLLYTGYDVIHFLFNSFFALVLFSSNEYKIEMKVQRNAFKQVQYLNGAEDCVETSNSKEKTWSNFFLLLDLNKQMIIWRKMKKKNIVMKKIWNWNRISCFGYLVLFQCDCIWLLLNSTAVWSVMIPYTCYSQYLTPYVSSSYWIIRFFFHQKLLKVNYNHV